MSNRYVYFLNADIDAVWDVGYSPGHRPCLVYCLGSGETGSFLCRYSDNVMRLSLFFVFTRFPLFYKNFGSYAGTLCVHYFQAWTKFRPELNV